MKKFPAWLVLLTITVGAALLLGVTNYMTHPVIEAQSAQAAEESRRTVLPSAERFAEETLEEKAPVDWCYTGYAGDAVVGRAAQVTASGFGGEIEVIVGADLNGVITGVNVGGANFSETAGLGAKTREPAFGAQYVGKSGTLRIIKAGQDTAEDTIDAVTAATISSTAVNNAVNTALEYITSLD